MPATDRLAEQFERNRVRLRTVAYRMLGSLSDADDAVQETWLRLSRADAEGIDNLAGWLMTVAARVCLDMLRARKARREDTVGLRLPDPIVSRDDHLNPEHEAVLADSVGLALLVVLQTLAPAERLSYVLHDMFGVPFDDIAIVLGRSPVAVRQLASRARRRMRGATTATDVNAREHRRVVSAFLEAARDGNLQALLELLHPDVVLRADRGGEAGGRVTVIRGADKVAEGARAFAALARGARLALVNGMPGILALDRHSKLSAVLAFTVADGRIGAVYVLADRARLDRL